MRNDSTRAAAEKLTSHRLPESFLRRHADKIGAAGSIFAGLCCLGFPAALSLLAAVGLGFLINDAVLLPALAIFLAVSIYGLWRGYRRHHSRLPLTLGSASAAALIVFIWFSPLLTGVSLAALVVATFLNISCARKGATHACDNARRLKKHQIMSDCCSSSHTASSTLTTTSDLPSGVHSADRRHLIIVGGGGAAFAAALKASELGARTTIINDGFPMGGTCVNVGCVPSKTLIRGAEALHRAMHPPPFDGIVTSGKLTDFKAVIAQKRALVGELRQAKYADVIAGNENIAFVAGRARLVDARTVEVNGEHLQGDAILIATGARPDVPSIPGLERVNFLTNESAFELEELPPSLIVLGGRYIALECAQMFARFGSKVTVLQRSDRILPTEAPDLTDELTKHLRAEGLTIEAGVKIDGVKIESVAQQKNEVVVTARVQGVERTFRAACILVATGRTPNTNNLGLELVGVQTDRAGHIVVAKTLETNVPGVYAAGDVIGGEMFVYTAAYEGALAAENALNGAARERDYTALPWVIFTDPQVAGVGLDEAQAKRQGIDAEAATVALSHVPRAIAARDTRGFIKLLRDRGSDRIVGARILAPEGSELLMELALAIKFGITARKLASSFHAYLTLSEGVKLAALTFGKDVAKLSCCAA